MWFPQACAGELCHAALHPPWDTSYSGAGFKGPSAGLVALVSWGIKYFHGKCFCGPSEYLGTGLTASLAKLPL